MVERVGFIATAREFVDFASKYRAATAEYLAMRHLRYADTRKDSRNMQNIILLNLFIPKRDNFMTARPKFYKLRPRFLIQQF